MHHPTDRITHTTAFVTPVMDHWLEREIAQWVHPMKDRSDNPSHHERTLLPWSYILLPVGIDCRSNKIQYFSIKHLKQAHEIYIWKPSVSYSNHTIDAFSGQWKSFIDWPFIFYSSRCIYVCVCACIFLVCVFVFIKNQFLLSHAKLISWVDLLLKINVILKLLCRAISNT